MDTYTLLVFAILAAFVAVFWKVAQWAMNSARAARETESLTPADMEALRETCDALVADLRSAADECTAQVEEAIRKAQAAAESLAKPPSSSTTSPLPNTAVEVPFKPFEPLHTDTRGEETSPSVAELAKAQPIPEFELPQEEVAAGSSFAPSLAGDAAVPGVEPEPAASSAQGSVERIYELADQGLSWAEIAEREARAPAEVKLFLSLREMQSGAGNAA